MRSDPGRPRRPGGTRRRSSPPSVSHRPRVPSATRYVGTHSASDVGWLVPPRSRCTPPVPWRTKLSRVFFWSSPFKSPFSPFNLLHSSRSVSVSWTQAFKTLRLGFATGQIKVVGRGADLESVCFTLDTTLAGASATTRRCSGIRGPNGQGHRRGGRLICPLIGRYSSEAGPGDLIRDFIGSCCCQSPGHASIVNSPICRQEKTKQPHCDSLILLDVMFMEIEKKTR